MHTSGFTNTPVTKLLVVLTVLTAILASVTDTKYLLHINVVPHLWAYRQWWRLLTWQFAYANSTEVLFAVMTLYQGRVVERLWGSRKFASFLVTTLPYTSLLPPLILALLVRPLSGNYANYLPSGPTPIIFAVLAQYHAAIPYQYRYRLATGSGSSTQQQQQQQRQPNTGASSSSTSASPPSPSTAAAAATAPTPESSGIMLTSKSLSYLPAAQLALSAFPGSLLSAAVGWAVGYAYRNDFLPGSVSGWRVPAWLVGEKAGASAVAADGFEGLRRRLEGESAGVATGRREEGGDARRRTLGGMVGEMFGGAETAR